MLLAGIQASLLDSRQKHAGMTSPSVRHSPNGTLAESFYRESIYLKSNPSMDYFYLQMLRFKIGTRRRY